ncbi:MAG: hypothetical protein LIO63_04075, partial [Akkermansia sp.]|nr:hypothetical protein [Akkermansia sp.]
SGVCGPGEHILRAEGSNIAMSAAKYNKFIFRAALRAVALEAGGEKGISPCGCRKGSEAEGKAEASGRSARASGALSGSPAGRERSSPVRTKSA